MKTSYIVYDINTLKIIHVYDRFCVSLVQLIKGMDNLTWLNTSHPKSKDLLKQINEVNKTNL